MQIPTIDEFIEMGTPEWFGLGFIQLKTTDNQRYHFWHPEISPDVGEEEVHDHRYGFTSVVLRGSIVNEVFDYDIKEDGDMLMESVSCEKNSTSEELCRVTINLATKSTMHAGSHYFMSADTFHRTIPQEKSVTFLMRGQTIKTHARVIRRPGQRVCPFASPMHPKKIYEIMEDCLGDRHGYHVTEIPKGKLGEASKIVEEARELLDAHNQECSIMAAVELSDLYGAIKAYMAKHAAHLSFDDLAKMSSITERAFKNGHR